MVPGLNYYPNKEEINLVRKYASTIIVGANDGTGISGTFVFPATVLLWYYHRSETIPLDVSYSVSSPVSMYLMKIYHEMENSKEIMRICIACGRYKLKPTNIPESNIIPDLTVKAARIYNRVDEICSGGYQWTTNIICGVLCRNAGINHVLNHQNKFARESLNSDRVIYWVNKLYSPIIGKAIII